MKRLNTYILAIVAIATFITGCRKDDTNLDVDMSDYPQDITAKNEMDTWLTEQFTTPWNIVVQYRFDRSKQGDDIRNVTPVNLDRIKPAMQMILDNFVGPYKKVGGETFGKTYFHKEWVLFGSGSYNNDGSYTVGTSSNARTMTLYDLNKFSNANLSQVQWYTHVVHHEFTHALNQTIPIPPAYSRISTGDYEPDWVGGDTLVANQKGFVSPYGGSSFGEDFAEFVATFVTGGAIKYSNMLNRLGVGSEGYTRLKQKEAIVYDYMKNNFGIDIYALQAEVRSQLKTIYNITDPVDITQTFPFQLAGNKVSNITIDTTAAHYTTYGTSAAFNSVYSDFRKEFKAQQPAFDVRNLQFIFTSATAMTFRITFAQTPTTTTTYTSDYYMAMAVNPITGVVRFTKTTVNGAEYGGNGAAYGYNAFERVMLPYLTNRQFVAAYLPATIPSTSPLYKTFAGFYVSGTPANYFYGPVTYK